MWVIYEPIAPSYLKIQIFLSHKIVLEGNNIIQVFVVILTPEIITEFDCSESNMQTCFNQSDRCQEKEKTKLNLQPYTVSSRTQSRVSGIYCSELCVWFVINPVC